MILLKFLFLGNFLFISFNAFILIRYYLLSAKLFILSGLLFFKFLLRLIIFNIFLYLIFNLSFHSNNTTNNDFQSIILVNKDFNRNGIRDAQINTLTNLLGNQKSNTQFSLGIFNPSSDSLGILIPRTTSQVFLPYLNHVDFKNSKPLYYFKYVPSNLASLKLMDNVFLTNHQGELVEFESSRNIFLSFGENWFSTNQISIYLLILLLLLLSIDASFKFKVLK